MSFLKRLFGGGGARANRGGQPAKQIEHKGFTIPATPYKNDGQYQTCGIVSKEIGGVVKEHKFIRADRFAGLDDAVEVSLSKGPADRRRAGRAHFRLRAGYGLSPNFLPTRGCGFMIPSAGSLAGEKAGRP